MAEVSEQGTERVVMNWPVELKDQVRAATSGRGMTEFIMKAVNIYLGNEPDHTALEQTLAETRHFAQLVADQLVLGGDSDDRLQFLMELEFPEWIQTQGWPAAYAERVRHHLDVREELLGGGEVVEVTRIVPPKERRDDPPVPVEPEEEEIVEEPVMAAAPATGDDLFSRLKASGKLKVASDLPKPEPVVMKDLCPVCNEELIDGECWTCAS